MHDIITFLKMAVDRGEAAGTYGCYMFRETGVYAYNRTILAGVTVPYGAEYNVPAAPLDAALARMKSIDTITMDENSVTLRSGRLRSTIKIDFSEAVELPEMPEEWQDCPPGLRAALGTARDFCGTENWQVCVRLWNDRVTAFAPQRGVDITVRGLSVEQPVLLTQDTVDFIITHAPDEMAVSGSSIFFRWDDNRWMRAQTYNGAMPEDSVRRIIDAAGEDAPVPMDAGFKQAYADISAMCDKAFSIAPDGFVGRTGEDPSRPTSENSVTHPVPVPEDHLSIWTKEIIEPVIKYGTAWNPAAWPAACLFVGESMRGVVMGRARW